MISKETGDLHRSTRDLLLREDLSARGPGNCLEDDHPLPCESYSLCSLHEAPGSIRGLTEEYSQLGPSNLICSDYGFQW